MAAPTHRHSVANSKWTGTASTPDLEPYATDADLAALAARVAKLEAAAPPVVTPPPVIVPAPFPKSLQAAIDSAAPGAVIDVTGGPVYKESVKTTKLLSLIGAKTDVLGFPNESAAGSNIWIDGTHDVTIRGGDYAHSWYCGVMVTSGYNVRVEANVIHDVMNKRADFNMYGIAFSDFDVNRSHDCWALANTIDNVPYWHGIDTHGGQRIVIEDNIIHRCNRAIFITDSNAAKADSVTINRNVMDTPTRRPDVATTYPYNEVGITIIAGSTNVKGDSNVYNGWPNGNHRSGGGTFTNDKVSNPQ